MYKQKINKFKKINIKKAHNNSTIKTNFIKIC